MATVDDLFDYVRVDAPSCPQAVARAYIRLAINQWCERTKKYRHTVEDIDLVGGQMDYTIAVPANTIMCSVVSLFYLGDLLTPASPTWLDIYEKNWMTEAGVVKYYHIPTWDDNKVRIVRKPSESTADALDITVALKPSLNAPSFPDWFLSMHSQDIAHGALAMIMALQKKPYSNPDAAIYHRNAFNAATAAGEVSAEMGGTNEPLRTTPDY
jgi:hypothetical protein